MKKIICIAMCLATVFILSTSVFAAYEIRQNRDISISFFDKGDVNRDKKINQKDATLLLQYTAGWSLNATVRKAEADLNIDGKIDGLDALILLQKVAK